MQKDNSNYPIKEANNSLKKVNLFNHSQRDMINFFESIGESKFRATQVLKWIYHEGVIDFDKMSNLSKVLREKLKNIATLSLPKIFLKKESKDGTKKWLLEVFGGNLIEVVFIPENDRGTLCISSQAGCIMACPFCSTAHEGFSRNLSTAEVISQVWIVKNDLGWTKGKKNITNIVLMGMGEPLLNYEQIVTACGLMMDDLAFGLSKRRVTLSTSGVVPKIYSLKKDCDISLAISLHAPTDELRDTIVPINKKYPLNELIEACKFFVKDGHSKKHITWEYVLLRNVNDKIEHARDLHKLIAGISGKINLIPFNPFPGTKYEQSTKESIDAFQLYLRKKGHQVSIRKTRGDDISAACGQLVGEIKDRSRRERILKRGI